MNRPLLEKLIDLLTIDAHDFNPFGHRRPSATPGKNGPVNLAEHLCHLTGFDFIYAGTGEQVAEIKHALGITGDRLIGLIDPIIWPRDLRLLAQRALRLGDTPALVNVSIKHIRNFMEGKRNGTAQIR